MRLRLLPALLTGLLVGSLATTANANAIWSFTATYQVPLPANYASSCLSDCLSL
jgi:hypothetical protein